MKTVILCGGLGSRLSEETRLKPKPMVEIGGIPILCHVIGIYETFGHNEFVLATGYKSEIIKEYFQNFYNMNSDLSIDLKAGTVTPVFPRRRDWTLYIRDTGHDTMTGGRLLRLRDIVGGETFMLTYGDGVADVDIDALIRFHEGHGRIATVTAVRPPARFGDLHVDGDRVASFDEKSQIATGWINGGFFVFEPGIFDYLENDATVLEKTPLETLAAEGHLMAFRHERFWQCMDTMRDKLLLEHLWANDLARWPGR